MLNKSNPLGYVAGGSKKSKKKKLLLHLDTIFRVWFVSSGVEDLTSQQFFFIKIMNFIDSEAAIKTSEQEK